MRQIKKESEPAFFSIWKEDFRTAQGREPEYDDLVKTREYFRLKESLLKEQGYICCYCEKQIGQRNCNIEHYMPRHPDSRELTPKECALCREAQLTYTNLFVSCGGDEAYSRDHCNHKKDNWFSFQDCISLLDPRISQVLGYKLDGSIFVADPGAREMINHLNLSSYVLEEQRKAALDTVLEVEFEDEDLLNDREYVEALIEDYDNMQDGKYAEFCSMITYCLRKYYLPSYL